MTVGAAHAHSKTPVPFEHTAAAQPDYQIVDLSKTTPLLTKDSNNQPALRMAPTSVVNVEFYKDIRPILRRSCTQCHTKSVSNPPGNLVLDDDALDPQEGLPGDYLRLAKDDQARWGHPPVIQVGDQPVWRQTNASRYIRAFQSRRSLLIWKIFGRRLDGWTNRDHPTETVPGDPTTLPPGASPNDADLDFTGTIMPPPDSNAPALTPDEKRTMARWIDLGCPINYGRETGHGAYGWSLDEVRPTLTVSVPRPGYNAAPLTEIRFGMADAYTGINVASLSVTADIRLAGRQPGSQLRGLAQQAGDGIYVITLSKPLTNVQNAHLFVEVADRQGNITRVHRKFSVGP